MFKTLRNILPVPEYPIDIDYSQLDEVQRELNISFPNDFVEYSRIYGTGTIVAKEAYSWEIYSAFRPSLPGFVGEFYESLTSSRASSGGLQLPISFFPEEGGLLPFGARDDIYFTWKTNGDPELWTVTVIWDYEEGEFQEFNIGFVEFLIKLLTKELRVVPFKPTWKSGSDISFITKVYGG